MARPAVNYDVNPGALKTIEGKLRQMQATGANITPEMMQALYSSVLEVGADKAGKMAATNAMLDERRSEFNQNKEIQKDAIKSEENRGMANAIGKGVLYGGRYANKKGYLDPLKFWEDKPGPGGTTTPEGLKTIGGQEFGTQPTQPSILGENPLGLGDTASMELGASPASGLPGPVTTPPVSTGMPTLPSFEPGAGIIPEIGEVGGQTLAETAPSIIPEIAPELGVETAEIGTKVATSTVPELGVSSVLGPMGAGAMGYSATKALGVNDDIGKGLLFGEGGKNEQDMAGAVATGAGMGAMAGTYVFPGIGTAVGGILGAIGGGLSAALDDLF